MIEIPQLALNYSQLLPYFVLSLIITILLTPVAGRLAHRFGALDMPARLAGRVGRNLEKRINDKITPRLGGLGMIVAILGIILLDPSISIRWGIVAGLLVIAVMGILDDIYDLPSRTQFSAQFIAAALVVASGVTITFIQVAGVFIDLNQFSTVIEIAGFTYYMILPADIITILWIMAIMNFINWVSGIDGLNGSISAIASFTILLISMRTGNLQLAVLNAIFLGAVLGVLPFNYHPSKIFYGFGEYINGFLLAVFSLLSGSKLAISIIILGLPIIDALFVIITRIIKNPDFLSKPWTVLKVITQSDKNHLHHRLLAMGFSWKMVLLLEVIIMGLLCTVAFYFSGFSDEFIAIVIALSSILFIYLLALLGQRYSRIRRERQAVEESLKPKVEIKIVDKDNDEKYVY